MDNITQWSLQQLGVAACLFIILLSVWNWMSNQISKMFDRFDSERERVDVERQKYLLMLTQFQACINDHTSQAKEFHTQVSEAHKYQRDEHEKLLSGLIKFEKEHQNRQNESSKMIELLEKLLINTQEQGQVLARINGYKDSH